jgi:ubiquinone/menaquinone biosynthesis C-methylase UbiE
MVESLAAPRTEDEVVDFGSGWGTFELALAPKVRSILGIDFSARSVELSRETLERHGAENVRFLQADAGDTGLEADRYDLVIAADLFEHLYPEDSVRVAREAFRILRPGGRFAVWTPHRGHILEVLKNNRILLTPDPAHVDYKSMPRMRALCTDAGFRIERAYYAESHLPVLSLAERTLGWAIPLLRRRIAIRAVKPV